jgi:hypothetical protein
MPGEHARPALYIVLAGALLIAFAVFWFPRWWENREYRRAEAIAGVGSRTLPGSLAEGRRHIDPGIPGSKVIAALGPPSFSVKTEGASTHEIWKYYFSDGTLTVNLTDGYVARISADFGPPKIRKSKRP